MAAGLGSGAVTRRPHHLVESSSRGELTRRGAPPYGPPRRRLPGRSGTSARLHAREVYSRTGAPVALTVSRVADLQRGPASRARGTPIYTVITGFRRTGTVIAARSGAQPGGDRPRGNGGEMNRTSAASSTL